MNLATSPMTDMRRKNKVKKGKRARAFKTLYVRMPAELAEKVDKFSRASWRTLTAEIVHRLEASFENQSINEHGVIVSTAPALKNGTSDGSHP